MGTILFDVAKANNGADGLFDLISPRLVAPRRRFSGRRSVPSARVPESR